MLLSNDGRVRSNVAKNAQFCAAVAHSVRLRKRNRTCQTPVTGDGRVNVSLTSYGRRLNAVWLAVETIGLGDVKPRRLILWLDDADAVAHPPERLRRLQLRGLEIRRSLNYGPHKKYFPYVSEILDEEPDLPLVTADDDVLYPPTWLSELMAAHHDGEVTAFRARVRADDPYRKWQLCDTTAPSDHVLATGVSGVVYPLNVLQALRERGDEFMRVCPRADDFWLHYAAVAIGAPVRQVRTTPAEWWSIPSTMLTGGLCRENMTANDQIHALTRAAWGLA